MSKKIAVSLLSLIMMLGNLNSFVVNAEEEGKPSEETSDVTEKNIISEETPVSEDAEDIADPETEDADSLTADEQMNEDFELSDVEEEIKEDVPESDATEEAAEINEERSSEGEAYAILTEDGELIFFRSNDLYTDKSEGTFTDVEGNHYTGIVYSDVEEIDVGDGYQSYKRIPWYDNRSQIMQVKSDEDQIIKPVSMSYWFYDCSNLMSADMRGFDTSNVTDIYWMFYNCSRLTSLDVSSFDTSNVTDMSHIFRNCSSLTSLDLNSFDTSNVTRMDEMFDNCSSLTSLDVSSFNTCNVTHIESMFSGCSNLTSLDLSSFDTSNVTDMSQMFYYCSSLTSLDVSGFDTSKVRYMYSMFSNCSSLKSVKLGSKFTNWGDQTLPTGLWINKASCISVYETALRDNYPKNASSWAGEWIRVKGSAYATLTNKGELIFFRSYNAYSNNKKGTFEDISGNQYSGTVFSGIETKYTGTYGDPKQNVPWFDYMESIKSVRVADCEEQLICPVLMSYWFNDCRNLSNANMDGFVTFGVQRMIYMFNNCDSLTSLNVSGLDTRNVINMGYMFTNCSSLTSLDVSGFDTSNVTSMYEMFYGCSSLTSLDVSSFDTSNVTSMSGMFQYCSSLTSLDVSGFDTSNVTDMESMFSNCSSLTSLDVSGFDTSNVSYMSDMFYECSSLTSLNVSGFKTSKVIGMSSMFLNCSSLTSLDVSGFDTSNVPNMRGMFLNCSSLTSLDVSSFDTSNVTDMGYMFSNCSSLTSLDVSSFDTSNVRDQKNSSMAGMFSGLNSLVSVKLGRKFTQWNRNAYLPEGIWINTKLNISLSEKQLYAQYPSHSNEWAGTWIKYDGMPKSIRLNQGNATITVNDTLQLDATVEPENATNKTVSWSSNNDNVATVNSSGQVIGKTVGKAIITAATINGLTAECAVRVLFTDVANSSQYFYIPVYWAVDNGITVGAGGPGKFSPNASCTREQFVTFLWRLMEEPEPINGCDFTDVSENAWYYKPISWAYENGITTGLNDGTGRFGVGQACTREQCVTFLYRSYQVRTGITGYAGPNPFTDVKSDAYYYVPVLWAAGNNITTGLNDGTGRFGVGQKCTRGMLVTFLYRYDQTE